MLLCLKPEAATGFTQAQGKKLIGEGRQFKLCLHSGPQLLLIKFTYNTTKEKKNTMSK